MNGFSLKEYRLINIRELVVSDLINILFMRHANGGKTTREQLSPRH